MSKIVKIELLSDKNLNEGDELFGYFVEDAMYDSSMPMYRKYLIRLFDENNISCGYGINDSLFSKYGVGDIVQAKVDLAIADSRVLHFEVVECKQDISKNKKKLFMLKLLDKDFVSSILGEREESFEQPLIEEFLTDDIKDKLSYNNDNKNKKTLNLNVKGDAKLNPKKTTVSRLIKTSEKPIITIALDNNNKWRAIYEGEYAGEILDMPSWISMQDIISVECNSSISLGYSISLVYNESKLSDSDLDGEYIQTNEVYDQLNISTVFDLEDVAMKISNPTKSAIKEEKGIKADEKEFIKIVKYLNECRIPDEYIKKITSSYIEYDKKYFERIPHSASKDFKLWRLSDKSNNLLLKAIMLIEEGMNARFVGGKGAGKDTLLYTLGWIYQRPIFTQSANRDTDITHLFGDKSLEPKIINDNIVQTIGFQKGLLIEAMEVGGIYEFGEGNTCKPELTMALHTILDHRRSVDIEGYKLVKAHPNFSFILTMNVDYDGCNELNPAFRDRFSTVKFPPPTDIEFILRDNCPFASNEDIRICNRIYKSILELSSEFQTDTMVTIRGYINALILSKHLPLMDALECSIIDNLSDDMLISKKIRHIVENLIG